MCRRSKSPAVTELLGKPLTESNGRPPPYHGGSPALSEDVGVHRHKVRPPTQTLEPLADLTKT